MIFTPMDFMGPNNSISVAKILAPYGPTRKQGNPTDLNI
jgi:hypothetical protein